MAMVDQALPSPSSSSVSRYASLELILNPISSVLHDQLIAAQQHLSPQNQDRPQAPRDHGNNIDPAISGGAMMSGPAAQTASSLGQVMSQQVLTGVQEDSGGDDPSRKAYGKRELSTSKRAAQNRAAQV